MKQYVTMFPSGENSNFANFLSTTDEVLLWYETQKLDVYDTEVWVVVELFGTKFCLRPQ